MRFEWILTFFAAFLGMSNAAFAIPECDPSKVLGVSRTIRIDNAAGPRFGTHQYAKTIDLKHGEVVLTFDDGPYPKRTKKILSALKRHCTKATFFSVGAMALAYPETLKLVARAGHTIGTHTYHHTNLQRVGFKRGKRSIERGIAAVLKANGHPIAPFFRYPYLRPTSKLHTYLRARRIAVLSADVISGDTSLSSGKAVIRRTMRLLKRKGKGIVLLHDINKNTAFALPALLNTLKAKGYKVVHIAPRTWVEKVDKSAQSFVERAAKKKSSRYKSRKKRARAQQKRKRKRRFHRREEIYVDPVFRGASTIGNPSG